MPPWAGNYHGTRGTYTFRHLMRGNFLYIDGHVRSLEPEGQILDHEDCFKIDL